MTVDDMLSRTTKKRRVLEMLRDGHRDVPTIAVNAGCVEGYVYRVAAEANISTAKPPRARNSGSIKLHRRGPKMSPFFIVPTTALRAAGLLNHKTVNFTVEGSTIKIYP